MSLSNRRLAWTLVFEPRRREERPPPWPELVSSVVGQVALPEVDPVTHILRGPFPEATLARLRGPEQIALIFSGVGRRVVLTLVDNLLGEHAERFDPNPMRARLASVLLGLELPAADAVPELLPTPERLGALLAERFEDDPDWEMLGLCEVAAVLQEGVPADLPDADGFAEHLDLRIERAVGVGRGHLVFVLTGYHATETDRRGMDRRLFVLTHGHQQRIPPFAEFSAHALDWGKAARAGLRLCSALDGVIADVRVAASWAVVGGPLPVEGEPDFDQLAARLEMLRVRLREVSATLRGHRESLSSAAVRILPDAAAITRSSPFTEASDRADELAAELDEREANAARWAQALSVARQALK